VDTVVNVGCVLGGLVLIGFVLDSALRTFVLPRGVRTPLTRGVFTTVRMVFNMLARETRSYESRDRVMALYAPVALLGLVVMWISLVLVGYSAIYYGLVTVRDWREAIELSGSSLFTLGFILPPDDVPSFLLVFTEAAVGLGLFALLIAFLPTIYSAFSRREVMVAQLGTRAGSPPSAVELLQRYHGISWTDRLPELWASWELWFAELEETHTSLGVLVFFRSPNPGRSWVTAAGAVLELPRSRSRRSRSRGRRRLGSASAPATSRSVRSPASSASSSTRTRPRAIRSASTALSSTRRTSSSRPQACRCDRIASAPGAISQAGESTTTRCCSRSPR
jgi:hypothetical protein